MIFRKTETELTNQEYTDPGLFNDEVSLAIRELREKLKEIAEKHSAVWRKESTSLKEYETIRKTAREDLIDELGVMVANFK